MEEGSSFVEMSYAAITVFASNGTLDVEELNFLLGMALKDGKIDDDEKKILKHVLNQVTIRDVTPRVWDRIQEVREKYGIN